MDILKTDINGSRELANLFHLIVIKIHSSQIHPSQHLRPQNPSKMSLKILSLNTGKEKSGINITLPPLAVGSMISEEVQEKAPVGLIAYSHQIFKLLFI